VQYDAATAASSLLIPPRHRATGVQCPKLPRPAPRGIVDTMPCVVAGGDLRRRADATRRARRSGGGSRVRSSACPSTT
jgi:hypothetical protein